MKITFTNDFHNTRATVRVKDNDRQTISLGASAAKRIRRELCATPDCACGKIRGPITDDLDRRWSLVSNSADSIEIER